MKITLSTPLEKIFRLSPKQKDALKRMSLFNVEDLLYYFPIRYNKPGKIKSIEFLKKDEEVVVFGKIRNLKTGKTFRSKIPISSAILEDSSNKIRVVWFREPYIAKMFKEESLVRIEGKVGEDKNGFHFTNPKIEKVSEIPEGTSDSLFASEEEISMNPVYRESMGITSYWIYHSIQKIFLTGVLDTLKDPIPEKIIKKYNLPSLKTSLIWIHTPKNEKDAEIAKKRFAFEEIFIIQIDRQKEKYLAKKEKSFIISKDEKEINSFINEFPFPLTSAQDRAIETVLNDLKSGVPMSRLLEGDVGSGKTAVSAVASYVTVKTTPQNKDYGSLQVAYMAPTEILAEQHFESFISYFKKHKIEMGLITGSGAKKFPSKIGLSENQNWTKISKAQLLKWVANGEIPILIGTHSLIQKNVKFKNLGLIVIDEQHRFGVKQRKELRKKPARTTDSVHSGRQDVVPHLLSMTATPIPRTLALTIFGDLDLSLLDELPKGRQLPETKIILPQDRDATYEKIREELNAGRQVFVICPRINEPDPNKEMAMNTKSVIEEVRRLQEKIFKEFKVGAITGKMTPKEKEEIMKAFKEYKFQILVATSVIEVGVNVPNATVMLIENAERFGLAQLHQMRGRILRSSHKPYCFVFADTKSSKTITRLKSFINAKNGFELAEEDLKNRGAGDLSGNKQWGISDLGMEALKNIKMVEAAREEAKNIIEKDFDLSTFPSLKEHIQKKQTIHME